LKGLRDQQKTTEKKKKKVVLVQLAKKRQDGKFPNEKNSMATKIGKEK